MIEDNNNTDYPENRVIEASLAVEGQVDTFEIIPDQVSLSNPDTNIAPMLITLSFQVTESFSSGEEWTVNLYDKDDNLVGSIDSANVAGFDSSGYMQLRWLLPDTGEGLRAEVKTSDDAQYSDAAYEISVTTTGVYETNGQVGRLPEGIEIDAVAASANDPDEFGFYVESGSETSTLSLTFSAAGTLTLTSSNGQTLRIDGNEANGFDVDADTAVEFDVGGSAQFITVAYTADAAGSYSLLLSDVDGSGRVLDAPTVQIGDVLLQDSKQYLFADAEEAPELILTENTTYALSELIRVSDGADYLYLIAGGASALTLSGDATGTVSSTDTAPTEIAVASLDSTFISIGTGSATLAVYAQYTNAFEATDSELALVSSGYLETNITAVAQSITLTTANTTTPENSDLFLEGEEGELTISLGTPDSAGDTVVEVRNTSGDIVFANGSSTVLVTVPQNESSATVTFTALANDTDFNPSEDVTFVAEVTSGDALGLQVQPLTVEVTETVPQFTVTPVSQGLLVTDQVVEYEIALNNAADFAAGDVDVTLSIGDDFLIGSAADSLAATDVVLSFGDSTSTLSVFAGASTSILSSESLAGAIQASVAVGEIASQVTLSTMAVTRVSAQAVQIPDVNGTTGNDGFFAAGLGETFNGLAGDDSLTIVSDGALLGAFNGGSGTDTIIVSGVQDAYTTAEVEGTTYLRLKSGGDGISINGVELVTFSDVANVAIDDLNSPPTVAAQPAAVSVAEGSTAEVDLSGVFSDPDGDALTLRMQNLPSWAEFDSEAKILTLTPGYSDSAESAVTLQIEATDTGLFSSPVTSSIEITVTDTNRTPIGSDISGQFISIDAPEDWGLALGEYFADPDGDSLTYTVVGMKPDWVSLTSQGTMTASAPTTDSGAQDVTVKASDGVLSTTKTFALSWGDQPELSVSEGFVDGSVSVDIDALVSAYGLSANDVAIVWEKSNNLTDWSDAGSANSTSLVSPAVTGGQPTFVRAKLSYTEGGADRVITTDPTLIKDEPNFLIEARFADHIDQFVTANIDLDPVLTPSSGGAVTASGFGYDLYHFAADSLPTGTFEMSLAANNSLAPDVGISDVIASLRHIVGLSSLEGTAAIAADMDGNDEIGISDVISQLRQIVGLEQSDGFKSIVETSEGYTDQLSSDLIEQPLIWVAMGDVDSSYTLDIV